MKRICLIEDDPLMGESLVDRFRLEGYAVDWCSSIESARSAITSVRHQVVISDLRLPDGEGGDFFLSLAATRQSLPPFVFITGYGTIDRAVELVKSGAADFVTKPFDLDALVARVGSLCRPGREPNKMDDVGRSPAMQRIAESLPRLARQASTLLVTGESGVGKEFIARLFHEHAYPGGTAPFVAVNCAALPQSLMEAELFGHEKGAFTGASRAQRGLIEQAHMGTLLLDEIGEMPLSMQAKLLRVLQDRQVRRIGAERSVRVEFKLVCATHRDLREMVKAGDFREDLFYRINVIQLPIPALRERSEDIIWLLRRFVDEFCETHEAPRKRIDARTESALIRYSWPGNIRELKNAVERACILSPTPVLGIEAFFADAGSPQTDDGASLPTLAAYMMDVERDYIRSRLDAFGWQIQRTADALGISRKTLWEKMRKLELSGSELAPTERTERLERGHEGS